MQVEVRFFAALVDRVGERSLRIDVEPTTTTGQLWRRLQEAHPALADLSYRPMVACDLEYADWERSLDGVREVAFLPPVSGG